MTITHENYVHSKDIDLARGFTWDNALKKLYIDLSKLVDNDFLILNPQTGKATVNPTKFENFKQHLKDLLEVVKEGLENRIDTTNENLNNLKDTLERLITKLDSEGNPIKTKPSNGLIGNGTIQDPLGLNLNTDDLVLNSKGQLELAVKKPSVLSNLNNNLVGLGFHTFSGFVNNTGGKTVFVEGVPKDFKSKDHEQASAGSVSDLAPDQNYDFNGYYVASEHEVIMTILNGGITWTRSNEVGMNLDGSLKSESAWSNWKRETNINISVQMIEQHTRQIQDLLNRLGTAESKITSSEEELREKLQEQAQQFQQSLQQKVQELTTQLQSVKNQLSMPCEMHIKTVGSHTIANTDNVILSNGGEITIPTGLSNGRMFIVIQATESAVTIKGANDVNVVQPLDGSLKLAGLNAVVTILIVGNKAHVFGQTE